MIERVHRYREKAPLFEAFGVEQEIRSTLERRVDLPSGGYLVFDYAEAFTVIDVNTGRFVGSRGKSASGRLEDTIVKNNLEAVKEVVRQLRLRDIGGIIVIDFIDMSNPKNRATVEDALRTELERDRTKTYVVEISPLGLVEMTRQNVTDGPREILTTKCAVCGGDGFVVSEATHALEIERKLRALAKGSRVQAFKVAVHPRVLALLAGPGGRRLAGIEAAARRRFFLVPAAAENGHVHLDHFEVLRAGQARDARARGAGRGGRDARAEARRGRALRRGAGVGKVDGYEVVVAGAAKLVGKKVAVTSGASSTASPSRRSRTPRRRRRRSRSRPRRRSRRARRAARPSRGRTGASAGEGRDRRRSRERRGRRPRLEAGRSWSRRRRTRSADEEAQRRGNRPTAEAPTKKRTRRGSRGGRGRKPSDGRTPGRERTMRAEAERRRRTHGPTPRIHVPAAEPDRRGRGRARGRRRREADADARGRRRSGRPARSASARAVGTRGGRKRKKPATQRRRRTTESP